MNRDDLRKWLDCLTDEEAKARVLVEIAAVDMLYEAARSTYVELCRNYGEHAVAREFPVFVLAISKAAAIYDQ